MSRNRTTGGHTRRGFLQEASAAAASLAAWRSAMAAPASNSRPKIAALFTVLHFRSHAYNILENFLGPYYFNGRLTDPGVDIVSFYADQFPDNDMARDVAQRFNIPLYSSIDEAVCLGGKELAVDGVLAIGEHGDYPYNHRGQHMYPRKRFFDEAVAAMKRSNRFVPYFNDKHWSYRWDWSKEMFDFARSVKMPILAGSSVPLAQRMPPLELPAEFEVDEAVAIHGGNLEAYDFHGVEVLQSIVESRKGGETGVANVELLFGEAYKRAQREGRWSQELVDAAMQAEANMKVRRQPHPQPGAYATKSKSPTSQPKQPDGPYALAITYADGTKATVHKIGSSADRWNFACRRKGETELWATAFFNSPWGNRGLFKALSHAIQHLFIHREEPYPAERTLLTTGVVEAAMRSFEADGRPIPTPHLQIRYQAGDWTRMREMGKTWEVVTADTPQPVDFSPRPRQ